VHALATKKTTGDERPKLQSSHKRATAVPEKRTAGAAKPKSRAAAPAAPTAAKKRAAKELAQKVSKAAPAAASTSAVKAQTTRLPTKSRRDGVVPPESLASDAARSIAIEVAKAGLDKKAVGLEVLDVAGRVDYADYIVLMSGRSDRQVAALASGIEDALRAKGKKALSVEGLPTASWVLIDFGDVVVHIFQEEARGMYDLEGLWMDARRIPMSAPAD
jgi:ribosome-associated protein